MNVAGVCKYNPTTVILSHVNTEGGAMGAKENDFSACFSCDLCHFWLDNHKGSIEDELFYTRRAMVRTTTIWHQMGLVTFK